MENQNIPEFNKEKEPWIVFHAFPVEMWFWRIAVPLTLIISLWK